MKRIAYCILLSLIILPAGCGSMPPLPDDIENDITTNGFLDEHRFQSVITATAEPWARGVNERRDSSRNRAYASLQQEVIIHLFQQLPANETDPSNFAIPAGTYADLLAIFELGVIKSVYYGSGDETFIVYRISRYQLREKLEDIDPAKL